MPDSAVHRRLAIMADQHSVAVRFSKVSRHFGQVRAVDEVSFDIYDGEFFSMLGPSGSGKTTCLRLIAGFEQPDAGSIEIHGKPMVGVPPYQRDVNTVFQDYALFPHMTVGENVAYGLMIRKVPKAERVRRAEEMLEMVALGGFGGRRPSQLSGGQRQRVALARALVNEPSVLLLDEPLGALDLKLREQMQVELKAIQRDVDITFLFVTHDQEEALTLSDRIAVFNAGHIEQVGTAREIYEQPASEFVAGFVGTSNLLTGAAAQTILGRTGTFGIRPEKLSVVLADRPVESGAEHASGSLTEVVYAGPVTRYVVDLDAGPRLIALQQNGSSAATLNRGARVNLVWDAHHVIDVPDLTSGRTGDPDADRSPEPLSTPLQS
jgi:putative spermidine/putrescine transport system ATP-binding protein